MTYFSLYLLLCWSIIATLTWRLFPGSTALVALAAGYTAAPIFLFIRRLRWEFYPGALFRILVVRVLLYTQLLLPFVTAAGILGAAAGWPFGAALTAGRTAALGMFIFALALFTFGYVGSRTLVTREVEARIPGLPAEFDGLRIVQLSDLHVGPQRSRNFLARVVKHTTALRADIIAVTGDLIDDRPEDVAIYASALAGLSAPLGLFMIPGNHDVYAGWHAVRTELERLVPGHVLVNESRLLRKGNATLAIIGTGDPAGMQSAFGNRSTAQTDAGPNIPLAVSQVPRDTVAIALAHNPALFPALAAHNVALTLSGHTHWGQFAFPRRNWSLASRVLEYAMGAYQRGNALLYISPGTGYWGIPFRIGALPEITAITLRHSQQAGITMGDAQRAN